MNFKVDGPAADACGVEATTKAARSAAGLELTSGRAEPPAFSGQTSNGEWDRIPTSTARPAGRGPPGWKPGGRPGPLPRVTRGGARSEWGESPKLRAGRRPGPRAGRGRDAQAGPGRAERREPGPAHRLLCPNLPAGHCGN